MIRIATALERARDPWDELELLITQGNIPSNEAGRIVELYHAEQHNCISPSEEAELSSLRQKYRTELHVLTYV